MSRAAHKIYIAALSIIAVMVLGLLILRGYSYYNVILEERFFHEDHQLLKPSGDYGHGYGIIGSLLIIIGVTSYMIRKRFSRLARYGSVKHWLEFHIFLCTLGPILILFHTSLKFGGIVAISFWSMVAVFISGIIGRFIYIQIPRTIEGREMSLSEVRAMKQNIEDILRTTSGLDAISIHRIGNAVREITAPETGGMIRGYFAREKKVRQIRLLLKKDKLHSREIKDIIGLVKKDISLNRKIARMNMMQNLFKYWHVAHLPFAFVMLIIMLIHVGVTIVFGYRWIF